VLVLEAKAQMGVLGGTGGRRKKERNVILEIAFKKVEGILSRAPSFSFICAYNVWVIFPPPPRYQTETILPLSLILLRREYKQ
jgi:hypothetical protein